MRKAGIGMGEGTLPAERCGLRDAACRAALPTDVAAAEDPDLGNRSGGGR